MLPPLLYSTISVLGFITADADSQSPPSPVANFTFNGTYADETGTLSNAQAFGTYFTTNRFGESNSAIGFNGSQYARISGLGNLLSGSRSITIAGWYLVSNGKNHPFAYGSGFIENRALGAGISPSIRLSVSGDPYNGIQGNTGRWTDVHTTTIFPMGTWAHLTMVLQENLTPLIYMDGTALAWNIAPPNFSPIAFTSDYGIGADITDGAPYFSSYSVGAVSDLKFYDVAFTSDQVQALYNSERAVYEVTLTLKSSTNMTDWAPVLTNIVETYNPQEFYKNEISVRIKLP
jgi:hypothetical protein